MWFVERLRCQTAASVKAAVQLYFEPLSGLVAPSALTWSAYRYWGALHVARHHATFYRPFALPSTTYVQRGLETWRKRIEERRDVPIRRSQAHAAALWSKTASNDLEYLEHATEREYQNMLARWYSSDIPSEPVVRPLYYQTSLALWFGAASWVLAAMEAALLGLFFSTWFGFEPFTAYLAGTALALGLTVVISAIVHAGVIARHEDQPQRASGLLCPAVSLLGLLFVALTAALSLIRTAADASLLAPHLTAAVPYIVTALTIVLPALAGVLLSLARLFRWSSDLTRRWQSVKELKAEVDALYDQAIRLAETEQS